MIHFVVTINKNFIINEIEKYDIKEESMEVIFKGKQYHIGLWRGIIDEIINTGDYEEILYGEYVGNGIIEVFDI